MNTEPTNEELESKKLVHDVFVDMLKNFEQTASPYLDDMVNNAHVLSFSGKLWNSLFGMKAEFNETMDNIGKTLNLPSNSKQDLILHKLTQLEVRLNHIERNLDKILNRQHSNES